MRLFKNQMTEKMLARCTETSGYGSVVQGGIYEVICFPAKRRIMVKNDLGGKCSYATWRFEVLGTFTDLEAAQIRAEESGSK